MGAGEEGPGHRDSSGGKSGCGERKVEPVLGEGSGIFLTFMIGTFRKQV